MRSDHTQPKPPRMLMGVLIVALVIGIGATVLSVANAFAISNESNQREQERLAADIAGCERGNIVRADQRELGYGVLAMVDGILTSMLERVDVTTATSLRSELTPTFDRFARIIESIEPVDCRAVVTRPTLPPSEDP